MAFMYTLSIKATRMKITYDDTRFCTTIFVLPELVTPVAAIAPARSCVMIISNNIVPSLKVARIMATATVKRNISENQKS